VSGEKRSLPKTRICFWEKTVWRLRGRQKRKPLSLGTEREEKSPLAYKEKASLEDVREKDFIMDGTGGP